MKLSIALPSKNRSNRLGVVLHNLNKNVSVQKEIIVAYAKDDTKTIDLLKTMDWVTSVEDGNNNAIVAYNSAMKATTGEYISYLTDDTEVVKGSYEIAIDYLDTHHKYVGVLFYHKDGDGSYHIHTIGAHIRGLKYEKSNWPFFMWGVLRNDMLREIGYWDERFANYYANPDMCINMYENGYKIIALPECKINHDPVVDDLIKYNYTTFATDENKFINKWSGIIK